MPDTKLVWIRCSGCNFRRKANPEYNVGYYHGHWNHITGGRAKNVLDNIQKTSICDNCGQVIHLSDTGEWFHELAARTKYDDIIGQIECKGFVNPVAKPRGDK